MGWDGVTPGTFQPGRTYQEEIAALNGRDVPQYVRLTVRKYWRGPDGSKDAHMDPALIQLTYGDKDYNDGAWQINEKESTTEAKTYYYSKVLEGNAATEPVVSQLRIDDSIVSEKNITETRSGDTITYSYRYDGYIACVEADVQSLQTHNANDAIESLWGVTNVSAQSGKLTVK